MGIEDSGTCCFDRVKPCGRDRPLTISSMMSAAIHHKRDFSAHQNKPDSRLAMPNSKPSKDTQLKPISYADFGHQFIVMVINAGRLRNEVETVLKSTIEGSIDRLPSILLVASYNFELKDVGADPLINRLPNVAFVLALKGVLNLQVRLAGMPLKFSMDVRIRITVDVKTYAPLTIKLHFTPVGHGNVDLDVDAQNAPGEVLEKLKIIKPIVLDQIVREVNSRLKSEELTEAATIDILKMAEASTIETGNLTDRMATSEVIAEVEGVIEPKTPVDETAAE